MTGTSARTFSFGIVFALLVLMGATWPLWTSQTDFPQIPFLGVLCHVPGWVDGIAVAGIVIGAAWGVVSGVRRRSVVPGLMVVAGSLILLTLLDQHRLQPWTYELLLLAVVLALSPDHRGLRCCRALVISIYLWSGWSKVDPEFFHAHGQMLLEGLLKGLGLSSALWSQKARWFAAASMPVLEILIGVLLIFRATRRWGLWTSIGLHLAILVAVGPFGLGHDPAVCLWNIWFIVQNGLLFGSWRPPNGEIEEGTRSRCRPRLAVVVTSLAAGLPVLNLVGWFDHWPSWSVYSTRPEQVRMFVKETAIGRLPDSLRSLVDAPVFGQRWHRVNLDRWSFDVLDCPPYPQGRWRLAVARAVAKEAALDEAVSVHISQRTGWWTRDWKTVELHGLSELSQACDGFWLNTKARGKTIQNRL